MLLKSCKVRIVILGSGGLDVASDMLPTVLDLTEHLMESDVPIESVAGILLELVLRRSHCNPFGLLVLFKLNHAVYHCF